MAKSIDLLLLLFGSFLCLYTGNSSLYVNLNQTQTEVSNQQEQSSLKRAQIRSIYTQEIGVREKTNKNDGERVAEYLNYTGLNEGYAWCAAFVSWSFGQAGLKEPKTAWSPSLFPNKRIIWQKGQNSPKPQQGDGVYRKRRPISSIYQVSDWISK